jgi:hypothetical protein
MPLPKGTVRVYKRDGEGAQQFIGEDLIDHTPRDESVRIKLGEAFDVVGDRRQMEYVSVTLVEPVGGDWEMISSGLDFTKLDAWTFTFEPEVPAHGETTVSYGVRARWC